MTDTPRPQPMHTGKRRAIAAAILLGVMGVAMFCLFLLFRPVEVVHIHRAQIMGDSVQWLDRANSSARGHADVLILDTRGWLSLNVIERTIWSDFLKSSLRKIYISSPHITDEHKALVSRMTRYERTRPRLTTDTPEQIMALLASEWRAEYVLSERGSR